jgi:hypothetical protein
MKINYLRIKCFISIQPEGEIKICISRKRATEWFQYCEGEEQFKDPRDSFYLNAKLKITLRNTSMYNDNNKVLLSFLHCAERIRK